MSALKLVVSPAVLARWNRYALEQLAEQAARLAVENEELRAQLAQAEASAEFWHEQATDMQLQLCEEHNAAPGITASGRLVIVPDES